MRSLPPTLRLLLASLAVMVLLPALAVRLVASDAGMAVVLLLFFVADPLFAVGAGAWGGRQRPPVWCAPFLPALCFLLGSWAVFSPAEPAFLLYAAVYLLLGLAALFAALYLSRR